MQGDGKFWTMQRDGCITPCVPFISQQGILSDGRNINRVCVLTHTYTQIIIIPKKKQG